MTPNMESSTQTHRRKAPQAHSGPGQSYYYRDAMYVYSVTCCPLANDLCTLAARDLTSGDVSGSDIPGVTRDVTGSHGYVTRTRFFFLFPISPLFPSHDLGPTVPLHGPALYHMT